MDDPLRDAFDKRHMRPHTAFEQRLQCAKLCSLRGLSTSRKAGQTCGENVRNFDSVETLFDYMSTCDGNMREPEAPSQSKSGLKLIIGHGDGQRIKLSLSTRDFKCLVDEYRLPKTFGQSILTNNGSFARFVEYEEIEDKIVPSVLCAIIQTPYSPFSNFSCAIRANIVTREATCLFFEKDKSDTDYLLQLIHANHESLHSNPISFISVLFQHHSYLCECYREQLDRNVVKMERLTGHTSINFKLFQPATDHESLTRELNACKTSLIFMDGNTAFENQLGVFCKETMEVLENLRETRKRKLEDFVGVNDELTETGATIVERFAAAEQLDYHLNLSGLRRIQALSLERRVQTQINVLYSLISQRDSKINILMAEDSKKIAMAVKKDSTAMKTISVVTMVFLPGTFVASIFSAGIFNFQGSADNHHIEVAAYWWVYFLVTILLTLGTVAFWGFFIRRRSRKDTAGEELGAESEGKEDLELDNIPMR